TFAELFFPNPDLDAAAHSGRQLVYRLRKLGIAVEGDQASIALSCPAEWDAEVLLGRGMASQTELEALKRGYLPDFRYDHSDAFSRWLDEHRSSITRK